MTVSSGASQWSTLQTLAGVVVPAVAVVLSVLGLISRTWTPRTGCRPAATLHRIDPPLPRPAKDGPPAATLHRIDMPLPQPARWMAPAPAKAAAAAAALLPEQCKKLPPPRPFTRSAAVAAALSEREAQM